MQSRCSFVLLAWLGLTAALYAEPTARLRGRVVSEGKPVAGASVMVSSAWPIKGLAYYCPGCYLDCGKSATTDELGKWEIEHLDDTLKFEVIVSAKGYVPVKSGAINPQLGRPVELSLTPRDVDAMPPNQVVRGRVLNSRGTPIEGAVVSPAMVWTGKSGRGGAVEGLDPLAVTDEDGLFALTYKEATTGMDLEVSARGFAHTCFPMKSSGERVHELRVSEGASVSGRLLRDGEPVRDIEITLVANQQAGGLRCYDRQTIATDQNGRFLFANVLPGQRYAVAASTEQLGKGCTVPRDLIIYLEQEGEEVEVGDLAVTSGVRVSGRVLPPESGPIPAGAKLSLSSQAAWDGVTVDLREDGSFVFPEVPPGEYSISLHAPGIYVSPRNASMDHLNINRLVGRIDTDLRGLEIATTTTRPVRPDRSDPKDIPELGGIERR